MHKAFFLSCLMVSCLALGSCGDDGTPGDDSGSDGSPDVGHDSSVDGGVEASASGLIWQDPPAENPMGQSAGRAFCEELVTLAADDWRLPTISELRTLVAGCADTEAGGACDLVDEGGQASSPPYESCGGCASGSGPGPSGCYWENLAGPCSSYWSTTTLSDVDFEGHALNFETASIMTLGWFDSEEFNIRCVRTSAD